MIVVRTLTKTRRYDIIKSVNMDDSEIINYVVACGNLSYRLGD